MPGTIVKGTSPPRSANGGGLGLAADDAEDAADGADLDALFEDIEREAFELRTSTDKAVTRYNSLKSVALPTWSDTVGNAVHAHIDRAKDLCCSPRAVKQMRRTALFLLQALLVVGVLSVLRYFVGILEPQPPPPPPPPAAPPHRPWPDVEH